MRNYLSQKLTPLLRDDRGQVSILMVMVLPAIFLFFSLALDAGVWFLDHRLAQNQVDAAALAAIVYLPAELDSDAYFKAENAVNTWLVKNGSGPEDLCDPDENGPYPQLTDIHPKDAPDGKVDAIRVCVRRQSPSIFAGLANLDFIYI